MVRHGRNLIMEKQIHGVITVIGVVATGVALYFAAWRKFFPENWYLWRLRSNDEVTRYHAAEKLAEMKSESAIEPLYDLLKKEGRRGYEVRTYAEALIQIGGKKGSLIKRIISVLDKALPFPNEHLSEAVKKHEQGFTVEQYLGDLLLRDANKLIPAHKRIPEIIKDTPANNEQLQEKLYGIIRRGTDTDNINYSGYVEAAIILGGERGRLVSKALAMLERILQPYYLYRELPKAIQAYEHEECLRKYFYDVLLKYPEPSLAVVEVATELGIDKAELQQVLLGRLKAGCSSYASTLKELVGEHSELANEIEDILYNGAKEGQKEHARQLLKFGGKKGQFVKEILRKLKEKLPEHKAYEHLPEALKIREGGYDFEVIYEPEQGHFEWRNTGVTEKVEIPGGTFGSVSPQGEMEYEIGENVWIIDSSERIEIHSLRA